MANDTNEMEGLGISRRVAKSSGESKFDTFTRGHGTMDKIVQALSKSKTAGKIAGQPVDQLYAQKGGKVLVDSALVFLALTNPVIGMDRKAALEIVNSDTYAKDA